MKLWSKSSTITDAAIEAFTVGRDREFDLFLAPFDVLGSLAHIRMLLSVGLLSADDWAVLDATLKQIFAEIEAGEFVLEPDVEDVHSQVELLLTRRLGDVGKKIHSGRSRNDQVLVDLKLFLRAQIAGLVLRVEAAFGALQTASEAHKDKLIPGYTHLQLAMPSSAGLWLGAYAEALTDDLTTLHAAWEMVNRNPLGSGAGYGSSLPLNRTLTTELLGFAGLHHNVVYAQMSRGKAERLVAQAMANIAATLARLSMDICLYLSQNFGFISFPDSLTTGSSIMPHKKNPDVFELIRGKCNLLQALPNQIALLTTNLPSGYHREMQLLKEHLFPAFDTLGDCLDMLCYMLPHMSVRDEILAEDRYRYLFSVEEVNRLVLAGVPFRDAYRAVGDSIAAGTYDPDRNVHHTHEGSIGNLCTAEIAAHFGSVVARFGFAEVEARVGELVRR